MPRLVTRSEIVTTAIAFIDGEKKRINADKAPLVATTWEMLENWLNHYLVIEGEYIHLKSIFKASQKQLSNRRDECMELYNLAEADLRCKLKDKTKEAFRDISTDWGLVFKSVGFDPEVYSHVDVIVECDDIPVASVLMEDLDDNQTCTTDEYGEISTNKFKIGLHRFKFSCKGYSTVELPEYKTLPNIDNKIIVAIEMVFIPKDS